jgi:hypothetical protein
MNKEQLKNHLVNQAKEWFDKLSFEEQKIKYKEYYPDNLDEDGFFIDEVVIIYILEIINQK